MRTGLILLAVQGQLVGCALNPFDTTTEADAWKRDYDKGFTALQQNNLTEAEACYKRALKNASQFGSSDYRLAHTLKELANTYIAQHNYDGAEPLLKQALAIYEKSWEPKGGGEDSRGAALNAAAVLLRLGRIDVIQGRKGDGETKFLRALAIEREQLGSDSLQQETTSDYVKLLTSQGRMDEARKLLRGVSETQASTEAALDEFKTDNWLDVHRAATSAFHAGNHGNALKLFDRALILAQRNKKPLQLARTLQELAELQVADGNYTDALRNLTMSLATYKTLTRGEHLKEMAELQATAASIHRLQRNYAEAEKTYQSAIDLIPKLGSRREERKWLSALAACYMVDKKYALAESTIRKKLDIDKALYDETSTKLPPDTLLLAEAVAAQNRNAEAATLFEKALELQTGAKHHDPRQTLRVYDKYAQFLRRSKRDKEAAELERKASAFRGEFEKNMVIR